MIPSDWSTHTYIQKLVARTPTYRQDFSAIILQYANQVLYTCISFIQTYETIAKNSTAHSSALAICQGY